jgi:glycine/D-amino acid oxidase-like deaminating enzyme
MTAMEPDVVVVGRGIVGAAVAMRLARGGRSVLTIDVGDPAGSATCASGAMLGVLGELRPHDNPAELALRLEAWARQPSWWDEIGMPPAPAGTFVVAGQDRPDDLTALRAMEDEALLHGLRAERVRPGTGRRGLSTWPMKPGLMVPPCARRSSSWRPGWERR